jgi:hypothetical protein
LDVPHKKHLLQLPLLSLVPPKVCLIKLYQTRKFLCSISFFSLELLILFILLNMFISEERQEAEVEVPPQSSLASPVTRAASPLSDEGESLKHIMEKKARKDVQKKRRGK